MRAQSVLICMLILAASATAGWPQPSVGLAGGQQASLDVLGSSVNNTTILFPVGSAVEVDIVGSTASGIQIGSQPAAQGSSGVKRCDGCGACGEKKCYSTPWDDFTRPLCYPWSSYIPTRYNRPFIKAQPGHLGSASQ